MKIKATFPLLFLFVLPMSLPAMETISVNESFHKITIGTYIEYLEDKDKKSTIDQVVNRNDWIQSKSASLNFGFTPSVYWFRFTIDNTGTGPMDLFLEITYPMLNYVDFYIPADGGYRAVKTGNKYPFNHREIEDKNFLFQLKEAPGSHTYYMRIETEGSLNFIPVLMSQKSYIAGINSQLPLIWIYYGLMLIMVPSR